MQRALRLPDVWLNPNFGGKGRKLSGVLEAHVNGFMYTSGKNEKLEIMFRCCQGGGRVGQLGGWLQAGRCRIEAACVAVVAVGLGRLGKEGKY